jgi:hypothetical protein
MGELLTSDDYPTVRRVLEASLDDTTLPDDVIRDPIYLDVALEYIASRTGDTGDHAKRAAIYYLASLLAPAMQGRIMAAYSIVTGGSAAKPDIKMMVAELRSRAETELDIIEKAGDTGQIAVAQRPAMFTLASGRRGA